MNKIKMTRGKYALVDDGDFEKVKEFKWYPDSAGYPITSNLIRMHRLILGLKKGDKKYVDHINGNKADNRRENLRICSNRQNMMNSSMHIDNKYGYKGVGYITNPRPRKKRWIARIKFRGRQHCTYYLTKLEAIYGYNAMAKKYFKEFAKLNQIQE